MKIGCVILAGGKSSRMGEDKALLELEGENFINRIADNLSFFEEKIVASVNQRVLSLKRQSEWKMIRDIFPEHGPIGGLHAALKICESDALFCVSCDVPLITKGLIERMCAEMTTYDESDAVIAVTADEKYHPLCAVYRKHLWISMEENILKDQNRLMAVLKKCNVRYMKLNEELSKQLTNVNTKEEYKKIVCNK